jgi:uncharacterized protein (TIGR02147 family)
MILDEQQLIRNILKDYFIKVQIRNPRFSLRAFAKKLGISNSALSEILRGKRIISAQKAMKYADLIGLESQPKKRLFDAFEKSDGLEKLKKQQNPLKEFELTPDKFHIMGDRVYFSILSLLRTKNKSPKDIAFSLKLDVKTVVKALDELIDVGIVKKNGSEYIEADRGIFRTPENFPTELLKKRRLQNNEANKNAIENETEGATGFFSTIAIDKTKLKEVEPIIEDFLKRLSLFLRKNQSEDIYEVSIDIFPWTKT